MLGIRASFLVKNMHNHELQWMLATARPTEPYR
jgi:hypothetical protein